MVKIRTKFLVIFLASILILALSSFYAVFFMDKLGRAVNQTTLYKSAADDISLHSLDINNILTLYLIADGEKLPALKAEYEFSMDHFHHALDVLQSRPDFGQYTSVINQMHDRIMSLADKVVRDRREQLSEEASLNAILGNLKSTRYQIRDNVKNGSEKLKLDIAQMGYYDKEFNFQYKDKTHAVEWLASAEATKKDLKNEGFAGLLPATDDYIALAKQAIDTRNSIGDLVLKNQYYLVYFGNYLLENDIAISRINSIIGGELDQVLTQSESQREFSFGIVFVSLVFGILIILSVAGDITRSLEELVKVAQKISIGKLSERVNIDSNDETGYLATVFNRMLDSIEISEVELKEETDQVKAIISSMAEGLLVVDSNYKITLINEAAGKFLGISAEKAMNGDVRRILTILKDKETVKFEDWPIEKMFKTGKAVSNDLNDNLYLKNSSGKAFPVEMVTAPLVGKVIIGAVIAFRDVTGMKLFQEESTFCNYNLKNALNSVYLERDIAQEQKNKLEAILNSIGDAVMAVDKEKRIIIFNPVAEAATGLKLGQVKDRPYSQYLKFVNESTKEEKTNHINDALAGKTVSIGNHTILEIRGKNSIAIEESAAPIRNTRGEIIGCIVVFRDTTVKREVERMRSDFISIVSHQLRTPLSAMKWFLEILINKDVGALKPKQLKVLKETYANNQNMIALVNQMLFMSRVESNRMLVNPEIINVDNAIKDIIGEIKPFVKNKRQELKVVGLPDKAFEINADKNLFKNIIINLIVNASKYTPNGGKIKLSVTKKNKNYLQFVVSDNGIGIPKSEQFKIFKKFSRATNAVEYEAGGTGLGLYIVKSILDMMGGDIRFESVENKGTKFIFNLPVDSVFCVLKTNAEAVKAAA